MSASPAMLISCDTKRTWTSKLSQMSWRFFLYGQVEMFRRNCKMFSVVLIGVGILKYPCTQKKILLSTLYSNLISQEKWGQGRQTNVEL